MRTTITIDDRLFETIQELTGSEGSEALKQALTKFAQYEAARQLARMGGSQPGFKAAPRRRPPTYLNP